MSKVAEGMDLHDLITEEEVLARKLRSVCGPRPHDEEPSKLRVSTEILYRMGCVYIRKAAVTISMDQKLNFIKAATLLHGARVRCQNFAKDKCLEKNILDELHEMENLLIPKFSGTLSLLEVSEKIRSRLTNARYKVINRLDAIPPLKGSQNDEFQARMEQKIRQVKAISKYCTEFYIEMMTEIPQECLKVCGPRPCDFAVVGLGSLARSEVTLHSNFEHVIILEDGVEDGEYYDNVLEYFRWFSALFHIVVIGLGETIVPSVGIEALNDFYSSDLSENWFHDSFTPSGVSFDGMMPHACKIPIGKHRTSVSKGPGIELIKPVSQMAAYLTVDEAQINGYCLKDVLSDACFVFGSEKLFSKFKTLSHFTFEVETLFSEVCKNKFQFLRESEFPNLREIDPKIQFYRPLSLLIGYAARLQGVCGKSGFDRASQLKDIPGCEDPKYIEWALAVACEIRLKSYQGNYNSHAKVSHDILESMGSKCLINCISVIRSLTQYLAFVVSDIDSDQCNLEYGVFASCLDAVLLNIDGPIKILERDGYKPQNVSEISLTRELTDVTFDILASKGMRDHNKEVALLAKAEKIVLEVKLQCADFNVYPKEWWKLPYVYYHQGRYEEAKELAESALDKFPQKNGALETWMFRLCCILVSSSKKFMQLGDFIVYCKDGFSSNSNIVSKFLFGKALVEVQCQCGERNAGRQLLKELLESYATEVVNVISLGDWIVWMCRACAIQRDEYCPDDFIETWEIVNNITGNGRKYLDIGDSSNLLLSAAASCIHLSCTSGVSTEKINLIGKAVKICQHPEYFSSFRPYFLYALVVIKDVYILDKFQKFKFAELCQIISEFPQSARDDEAFKTITVEILESIYIHCMSCKDFTLLEICHYVECSFQVAETHHPFLYPLMSGVKKRMEVMLGADGIEITLHRSKVNRLWRSLFASSQASRGTHFLASVHDYLSVEIYQRCDSKVAAFYQVSPDRTFQDALENYLTSEYESSAKKFWKMIYRKETNSHSQRLSITFFCNAFVWCLISQFCRYRSHFDIFRAQISAEPQEIVKVLKERSTCDWKRGELKPNRTYHASWERRRGKNGNNEIGYIELSYHEQGTPRPWWAGAEFRSNFRFPKDQASKGAVWQKSGFCTGKIWELRNKQLLEVDGIKNERDGDAPGQNCSYILSGDHEREEYRTATFAKFPEYAPVFSIGLSKMGFYYTGYKDRVKCFSCGASVENWVIGDNVFLPRWHKESCLMPRGGDPRNIPSLSVYPVLCKPLNAAQQQQSTSANQAQASNRPAHIEQTAEVTSRLQNVNIAGNAPNPPRVRLADIHEASHERMLRSLSLHREEDRRKTFAKWPSYPAPRLPRDLAKSGLFYLGNSDRTQCFCCGGVLRNWMATDRVDEQHQRHFSTCKLFTQYNMSGNIALSEEARRQANAQDDERLREILRGDDDPLDEPPDPPPSEKQRLAVLFPLNNTVNPEMATLQQRINSFEGWPAQTRATVPQIAKAGFFYLGEGDKTKCYYCNGGLQNWDRNDEPWTEHAKWFPGCAFILREKGVDFVKRLVELHPNLNRPTIRHPVSYNVPQDIPPNEGRSGPSSAVIDLEVVQSMGFSADQIQRVMRRKMDRDGSSYGNVQDLLNDLLQDSEQERNTSSMQEAGEHRPPSDIQVVQTSTAATGQKRNGGSGGGQNSLEEAKKTRTQSPPESMETSTSSAAASREMEESLRVMQESDKCKKCKSNPADVMCIPCGHLALCSNCSKDIKRCVVCNARVQSVMKVFRA